MTSSLMLASDKMASQKKKKKKKKKNQTDQDLVNKAKFFLKDGISYTGNTRTIHVRCEYVHSTVFFTLLVMDVTYL